MADVPSTITSWSTTAASNSPAGSTSIGTGLDDNLREIQAVFRAEYDKIVPAINPGGRLSLTTGVAVTTSDVTAATTLYYTPYKNDKIVLFDGTNWKQYTFTERSIAVPATTSTMYDVFLYDNAGTLTLELTSWTNDTTRATALTTQNGVLVKTGALTRRYLGSFRTTGVSGQTEDSAAKRYVFNYYNRVLRVMRVVEATNTWTYQTNTYRQANNSTANQLDCVIGVSEDVVEASVQAIARNDQAANTVSLDVGIGIDSTTTNSAQRMTAGSNTVVSGNQNLSAEYIGYPGVGRRTLVWLEKSTAAGTTTWTGDNNDPTAIQSGIAGIIFS